MSIFEWAFVGALTLGILVFCARIMRRGISTLDDDRNKYRERIRDGERQLAEDRKKISASEHLHIVRAALEDLVRLEDAHESYQVREQDKKLQLQTPRGPWTIELIMNERKLRSANKVLHGRSRWLLSGFGHCEHHNDPASVMRSLNMHLHSEHWEAEEPEHFARRFAGGRHVLSVHNQ